MADMHVLTGDGERWTVVMHFPVANANNAVNVNYRTALVNSGIGGTSALIEGVGAGQISTAELTQIQNGEVFEYSANLLVETGGTSVPNQRAMLRAEYAKLKTAITDKLQQQLKYFGHTESEA